MALLWYEGFDECTTINDTAPSAYSKNQSVGVEQAFVFSATSGRFGGGGFGIATSFGSRGGLGNNPTTQPVSLAAGTPICFGVWILISAAASATSGPSPYTGLFSIATSYQSGGPSGNTATLLDVNLANGNLVLFNPGNGTQLATVSVNICDNNWHWVEAQFVLGVSGTGTAKVYVDAVQKASLTGLTNWVSTTTFGAQVAMAHAETNTGVGVSFTLDDMVVWDTTGTAFNTFPLGPRRIVTQEPNAAGSSTQFTPSTSGAANYTMVNSKSFSGTTYVSSATTGQEDLYALPALSYTPTAINAVIARVWAQNSGATGTANVTPQITTSSKGNKAGATTGLTAALYTEIIMPMPTAPNGTSWSAADVNTMQVGVSD